MSKYTYQDVAKILAENDVQEYDLPYLVTLPDGSLADIGIEEYEDDSSIVYNVYYFLDDGYMLVNVLHKNGAVKEYRTR